MKIYFPKTNKQLCRLVVVCPGGGYSGSRHGWHWGTVTFDGKTVSDGSKYENLDDIKTKLMDWLVSF